MLQGLADSLMSILKAMSRVSSRLQHHGRFSLLLQFSSQLHQGGVMCPDQALQQAWSLGTSLFLQISSLMRVRQSVMVATFPSREMHKLLACSSTSSETALCMTGQLLHTRAGDCLMLNDALR